MSFFSSTKFDALPHYYKFVFLYLEPISMMFPYLMTLQSGPARFFNELVPPTGPPPEIMDPRAALAIWQLTITYFLLFILQSVAYRSVRDATAHNPALQEKVMGSILMCLAWADCTHVTTTYLNLPKDTGPWNTTTHGNITFTIGLFISRMSWFLGIARTRYYYGQKQIKL